MPTEHNPDNILHALKHCESQQHGAYLSICNKSDCHRPISHGEPVTIHAYYSECSNAWYITTLHCRDHNPDTTFNTNHSLTTAIVTAIFNHPTTIPPRNHPILSDFRFIETTAELPQLPKLADPNPGESKHVVSPEELKHGDYTTLEDLLQELPDNEQTTLGTWNSSENDGDAVTEPGNTLHDWFENENPNEHSFTDLNNGEEDQHESLTETEQDALDAMIDFTDLLNGDYTTEEELEDPEDRDN